MKLLIQHCCMPSSKQNDGSLKKKTKAELMSRKMSSNTKRNDANDTSKLLLFEPGLETVTRSK